MTTPTTTARTTPPPPNAPAPGSALAARNRRRIWIGLAAAIILLGAAIWILTSMLSNGEPRLNDNSVVLTKFVNSKAFDALPFEKQRQFYKVLDDRNDEIDQLYSAGRLTEQEYRTALEAGWLGKHINHVEKYFALPPGRGRDEYIDKLLDKKARKAPSGKAGAIKPDETAAEMKVDAWPPAVREQWKTFHTIYSKEKKARAATAPASATRPAKR